MAINDPRVMRTGRQIMEQLGTLPPDRPDESPGGPNEAEIKSDGDTVSELGEKWAMAERAQKDTEKQWKTNISFFEGIQWVATGANVFLNIQGVGARGKERVTDNRVQDHARRLHARLDRPTFQPTVQAMTDDPTDHEAGKAGEALLRNFYQRHGVEREKRSATWWIVLCGSCYLEPFFDPAAGNLEAVPKTDEAGNPVQEPALDEAGNPLLEWKEVQDATGAVRMEQQPVMRPAIEMRPQGEIDFVVRSPFAVKRDPRFQEWRKIRWVFVEETAAREEVLDRFAEAYAERTGKDLDKELGEGERVQTVPYLPDVAASTSDYTGLPRPLPGVMGIVRLRRYYERPGRKYPKGRHIIYAGKVVLWRGDLDTPDGDIPLVQLGYLIRPWLLEGKSPVGEVLTLQRLYNVVLSRWADHIRRWAGGWLLIPTTSGIPRRAFTSETGAIRYNSAGGDPKFIFPPFGSLVAYERLLSKIEGSMEERMALPPVMRGQAPRGAKAARMVELLKESADEIQSPVLDDIAEGWRLFWVKTLALAHKHYALERMVYAIGEGKKAAVSKFKGGDGGTFPSDWRDRLRVSVESGGGLPASRMARIELILALARQHGILGNPGTPDYVRKLKDALGLEGEIASDEDMDMSIADVENINLIRGTHIVVRPIDDDRVHLISHIAYAKRLVVGGKEREAAALLPHIDQHQKALQLKMLAATQGGAAPGGPGGHPGLSPKPPLGAEPQPRQAGPAHPGPSALPQESMRSHHAGAGQPPGGHPPQGGTP